MLKISKISKNVKKNAKNLIILDNPKTPKTKCKKRIYGFQKWGDCHHFNLGALAPPQN